MRERYIPKWVPRSYRRSDAEGKWPRQHQTWLASAPGPHIGAEWAWKLPDPCRGDLKLLPTSLGKKQGILDEETKSPIRNKEQGMGDGR